MTLRMLAIGLTLTLSASAWPAQTPPATTGRSGQRGESTPAPRVELTPETRKVVDDLIRTLNSHNTVSVREESKSHPILFTAYLDLTEPPMRIGDSFNQNTIHAKMPQWSAVSGWAESNGHMAKAILDSRDKIAVGLPYGRDNVPPTYVSKGLFVDLIPDGRLGHIDFQYLRAVRTISAYATAEVYRLMEANRVDDALKLALAHIFVLRQFSDRDFLAEKLQGIRMLSEALANFRDVFYVYLDRITLDQFRGIAFREIPFLRPDRNRLLMPEADRHVSEARLRFVFDQRSAQADPTSFSETFARIQSAEKPLTLFGASRRWKMIATIHGSLDATLERLQLIYDDWWRRWRVEAYDPILDIQTEFERCNPVRYAAVLYSLADIEQLFGIRNQLIAEVNGTAMAAGLCGYHKSFGGYPRGTEMIYAFAVRRRSDSDPHDRELAPFRYRQASAREPVDTAPGRIWIEPGMGVLYSVGQDNTDDRAATHTDSGATGDVVIWPPVKALQREAGLID